MLRTPEAFSRLIHRIDDGSGMQCRALENIALALHNYAAKNHGVLPPTYTVDSAGKPLHSWRTLILPYIDYQDLYKKIDLSKSWNDPANAEVFKAHVKVYHCPSTVPRLLNVVQ